MSYEGEETDFTNKVTELYEGVKAKIKQWTERLQVSMMLGTQYVVLCVLLLLTKQKNWVGWLYGGYLFT